MRFIVKIQLPEIDGHDENYMKCYTLPNEVINGFSKKIKKTKEVSNEETINYMRDLIKDMFLEGKIWDYDLKSERELLKEDIDELPMGLLDPILLKLMGNDLKVR
jgi:hypothetical protein